MEAQVSIIHKSPELETVQMPITDTWMSIHGRLLSRKKEEISDHATTWANLKHIMLRERSQTRKRQNDSDGKQIRGSLE